MKLLTVDTIGEARKKLLNCAKNLSPGIEIIPVYENINNRVLANDIYSPEDIPSFRRSAVDGYALIAADSAGAGEAAPVFLHLAGAVEMGKAADLSLRRGECAYVPTGGMLPGGADAMAMVEYCEPCGNEIAVYESAAVGNHVIRIGEDARQGALLLARGVKIRAHETGALAAAGITDVPVYKPLRMYIISSGDELAPPAAAAGPGQIRDINTHALRALAEENGYSITGTQVLKDDTDALETTVRNAMPANDIVVLSGGSSQGTKDLTEQTFSRIARPGVFTHGLAIKPGKPSILGFDEASNTILAGLPGHPVSALMVFRVLFSWLYRQLSGQGEPFPVPARLSCNIAGAPGRTTYQPVRLRACEKSYIAEPVFGKSGAISTLTNADGYIVIDLNTEGLREGELTEVFLF